MGAGEEALARRKETFAGALSIKQGREHLSHRKPSVKLHGAVFSEQMDGASAAHRRPCAPAQEKPGIEHACQPSTLQVGAERLGVQGHSQLEDGGQPGLQETCLKSKLVVYTLKESNPCAILVDIISRTARTTYSDPLINTSKEVLRGE